MSDSEADPLSAWDFAALFFTLLSAVAIGQICFGRGSGDVIFPSALAFFIALLLDFFSGKNWLAKLAVAFQILIAVTALIAALHFFGGMDH